MRETTPDLALDGIVLDDARTGQQVDLGRLAGVQVPRGRPWRRWSATAGCPGRC